MTPEEFARTAADFIRAQGELRSIVIDVPRDRLVVGVPPGPVSFLSLTHARREFEEAALGARQRVLSRRYWSAISRQADSVAEAVGRAVLPRVRDRAWFAAVRRQAELELGADEAAIDEVMLPHTPVNDELAVHLAFELATSVSEIGADRLQAWGLEFEPLYARALQNLEARSSTPFEQPAPGVFLSPWHDTFDASRVLLPKLFEGLAVKGAPVVLAPTHDLVFVTGTDDTEGLLQAAAWAEEALLEPRGHSAIAFVLEKGQWRLWMPPRAHPAWLKFKLLQLQTIATAYARQKEVLDSLLQANGHSLTVGTMRAFRTATGEIFTACAWNENVEALLPQTDRIDFVSPERGLSINVSFDVARQTLGDLMQPIGDLPERWRVRSFPSPEQLAKMVRESPLD